MALALALAALSFGTPGTANAADKPHAAAKTRPAPPAPRAPATPAAAEKSATTPAAAVVTEKTAPGEAGAAAANVTKTQESKEGVKTYQFGAVEVEGRLRSPQLIYFLRRVRAEFAAGDLGHRSFLRELSETARGPAFR